MHLLLSLAMLHMPIFILPLVTGLYYRYLFTVGVRRRWCLTYWPATGFLAKIPVGYLRPVHTGDVQSPNSTIIAEFGDYSRQCGQNCRPVDGLTFFRSSTSQIGSKD